MDISKIAKNSLAYKKRVLRVIYTKIDKTHYKGPSTGHLDYQQININLSFTNMVISMCITISLLKLHI